MKTVSVWDDEKVWRWRGVMVVQHCDIYSVNYILNCMLKNGQNCKFYVMYTFRDNLKMQNKNKNKVDGLPSKQHSVTEAKNT